MLMPTYEELLAKAISKLPKGPGTGERFVVPTADAVVVGNQTVIRNFADVCGALRREPRHLLKFLSKELAAPANLDGSRAIFQSKVPQRTVQAKLESYVKEFVVCKECRRPDTRLEKAERITLLVCEACGARGAVKQI